MRECSYHGEVSTETVQKAAVCYPPPGEPCEGFGHCKRVVAERVRMIHQSSIKRDKKE